MLPSQPGSSQAPGQSCNFYGNYNTVADSLQPVIIIQAILFRINFAIIDQSSCDRGLCVRAHDDGSSPRTGVTAVYHCGPGIPHNSNDTCDQTIFHGLPSRPEYIYIQRIFPANKNDVSPFYSRILSRTWTAFTVLITRVESSNLFNSPLPA